MKLLKNELIPPSGFYASGFYSGIKKKGLDTALIYSSVPANAAGTFTTNRVKAFCVQRNMEILSSSSVIQGIVINSGNANACTGEKGRAANERLAESAASALGIPMTSVLTASTGVIGVELPVENIEKSIMDIDLSSENIEEGFKNASEAILTTDTFSKTASIQFDIEGKTVTLSGMAKGSGMIHPDMATMLSFLTTDISISPYLLSKALKKAVSDSFNMISVDGDTSTNDMALILANGQSGNSIINKTNDAYNLFLNALLTVTGFLAKSIASDGEGATKLIEIEVTGAKTVSDAKKIARAVSSSNLVKTAFFGNDPNWGRIIAAMGYSGADFNPDGVSIYFQGAPGYSCLMHNGKPHHFDRDSVMGILREKNIIVTINLSDGDSSASAWGCDLSYDYVKINAEYTT